MKKKSGSRRTKVVHRSKKNLRRTIKRKNLAKGRRRPTRRQARVQRGGGDNENALDCLVTVANIYYYGTPLHLNMDYAKAMQLYKIAAAQGDADARVVLGFMFYNGIGVAKDDTKAMQFYSLAAKKGDVRAQYNLGNMFEYGEGVAQNDAKAVQWYRLAAEQGHVDAQYNLGVMLENGQGVAKDRAEAIQWYRRAAAQGDVDAKTKLDTLGT